MRIRKLYILIALIAAGLTVQAFLASPASAEVYDPQGIATSTNLLAGSSASSITNFYYNLASLPGDSRVTIQFSQDNSAWYSAAGTLNASTSLSTTGGADLSLSALSWSGSSFYYRMYLFSTGDLSGTPEIDEIRLDYDPAAGYENVFVFDNTGNVGIGNSTPSSLLTVGATAGSQFLVNNIGQVTGGTWQGSPIGIAYGGTNWNSTGSSGIAVLSNGTWSASSTLSISLGGTGLQSTPAYGQLLLGTALGGYSLTGTSSLNINLTNTSGTLTVAQGGTGSTTLSGLLMGNGTGNILTAIAGSDYVIPSVSTLSSLTSIGSGLSGLLVANSGALTGSTSLSVYYGGTGSTTLSGLLMGNGTGGVLTAIAGTDYLVGTTIGNGTAGYLPYYTGVNNTLAATSSIYLSPSRNIGIGTMDPTAKLDIIGSESVSTLGSNKVVNGTFDTDLAGWTNGGSWSWVTGSAFHATGSTATLSQNTGETIGEIYELKFTYASSTNGTLDVSMGGWTNSYIGYFPGSQTVYLIATNTNDLIFAPSADFDGTIDSISVKKASLTSPVASIRNSNSSVGIEIRSGGSGNNNTFIGYQSGAINGSGYSNTSLGYSALASNYSGFDNVAIGHSALKSNITGRSNLAFGNYTLYSLNSGTFNIAFGDHALYSNVSGTNIAIGTYALNSYLNSNNLAIGYASMRNAVTGQFNTALGDSTLYYNTGSYNTAIGSDVLVRNTSGQNNTALGMQAGYYNQTGGSNVLIGYQAGMGSANYTSANNNVIIGNFAGSVISNNSSNNILLGYQAGNNITSGSSNILIGYDIKAQSATLSSQLSIGNIIFATGGFGTAKNVGAGNVSIGTTSPSAKLTVWGNGTGIGQLFNLVNSASTSLMTVLDNGNVGIGTTTPLEKLDVYGNIAVRNQNAVKFYQSIANGGKYISFAATTSSMANDLTYYWPGADGSSGQVLSTNGNGMLAWTAAGGLPSGSDGQTLTYQGSSWSATSSLTVLANGYVGIGTSTPSSLLMVMGTSTLQDIIPRTNLTYNLGTSANRWNSLWAGTLNIGTSSWSMNNGSDGRLSIFDAASGGGNERLSILTNGNVGIGTSSPLSALNLYRADSSALLSFSNQNQNSPQWYIGADYNDSSKFKVGVTSDLSSAALTVSKTGAVGIGNTSPTYDLDVYGSQRITRIPAGTGINEGLLYLNALPQNSTTTWYNNSWDIPDIGETDDCRDTFGDLDGDGDLDVMHGCWSGIAYGFENTGSLGHPTWSYKSAWNTPDAGIGGAAELVDLDNDGDLDILIGTNTGTTTAYKNTGNANSPVWTAEPSWNVPDIGSNVQPASADLDNDGDYDLMVGDDGGIAYGFKNTGNANSPVWTAEPSWNTVDVGFHAALDLADLDNDGDIDMMITSSGVAYGYRNTGSVSSPTWTAEAGWNLSGVSQGNLGMVDIDNDGDKDLFAGNDNGTGAAWKNIGNASSPSWQRHIVWGINFGYTWNFDSAAFGDLDGDGDLDAMIGSYSDKIKGYKNTGTASSPVWTADTSLDTPSSFSEGTPALTDLDSDGDLDLLVGASDGVVHAYKNTGTISSSTWTDWPNWHTTSIGGNAAPATADLDNDGDYDLMIGSELGVVYGYKNTGSSTGATWAAEAGWNLADTGRAVRPALGDIDGDGVTDMMVGEFAGAVLAYKNTGTVSSPTWANESGWNIPDYGSETSPSLADLDNDGAVDFILFVGGSKLSLDFKNISGQGSDTRTVFGIAADGIEKFKILGSGQLNVSGPIDLNSNLDLDYSGSLAGLSVNQTGSGRMLELLDNGTAVFVVNDGGNVGIGTTSPGYLLHIEGDSAMAYINNTNASSSSGLMLGSDETGIYKNGSSYASYGGADALEIFNTANGPVTFYTNATEYMRITSGGNVGIGTTTPRGILDVVGGSKDIYFSTYPGYNIRFSGGDTISVVNDAGVSENLYLQYGAAADVIMLQDGAGNVGIGIWEPQGKLHLTGALAISNSALGSTFANAPTFMSSTNDGYLLTATTTGSDTDLRLYIEDDPTDSFSIYGNSCGGGACFDLSKSSIVATFQAAGNVGIGTSSPAAKLHIQGVSPVLRIGDEQYLDSGNVGNLGILSFGHHIDSSSNLTTAIYAYDVAAYYPEIRFNTTDTVRMTINAGGNVGIGTTSPTAKLHLAQTATGGTETFYPSATGTETNIPDEIPVNTAHWQDVDEVTTDDMTTYADTGLNTYTRDMYDIPVHSSGSGDIFRVTVYFRFRSPSSGNAYAMGAVRTGGATYNGSIKTEPGGSSWQSASESWYTNPGTGNAWTWSEIDALEIGCSIRSNTASYHTLLTQVYAVVEYGNVIFRADDALGDMTPFVITSSGNVGIGTSSPADKLDVQGGNIRNSALAGTGNRAVYSDANGVLTNSSSDRDLKKNIMALGSSLDVLAALENLRGVYYNWDTSNPAAANLGAQREIGMIAQDVELYMPELVGINASGYKSLDYSKFTGFLVEVAKKQQEMIGGLASSTAQLTADQQKLGVKIDENTSQISNSQFLIFNKIQDLNSRISKIESYFILDGNGDIVLNGQIHDTASTPTDGTGSPIESGMTNSNIEIVDLTLSASSGQTAFVVNQVGDGDIADFRSNNVSIMNIDDTGKVAIVGELLVDGRIMVCSGGACDASLDDSVDNTSGDMGVEGKIVAGAYEQYCPDGYVWIPGSAKYGTMPGFCVMGGKAGDSKEKSVISNTVFNKPIPITNNEPASPAGGLPITNISQGEAQMACQSIGSAYHLISEKEWLTILENIIKVNRNDLDKITPGLQLSISTTTYVLSTGALIHNLSGSMGEWSNKTIKKDDSIQPFSNDWQDFDQIKSFKNLDEVMPPYYLDSSNGIGKILTGDNENDLRGFVRGVNGIYSLDLSHAPTEATSTIGFRCAK